MNEQPMPPAQVTSPSKRRIHPAVLAAVAVVVLLAAAAGSFAVWRATSSEDGGSSGGKFTVSGSVKLTLGTFEWGVNGNTDRRCYGRGGYSDIREGAQVVVSDAGSKTIALGKLREGEAEIATDGRAYTCTFTFVVDGVPDGQQFYGLAIGSRERIQYTRDDIGKSLRLSLGSA